MFPNPIIGSLDLYSIFLGMGIIGAIVTLRIFADKRKLNWKFYNFCTILGACSAVCGYGSAVLFQALYNIADRGFELNSGTGATFYGGFIGGASGFFILYFIVGHFVFKKERTHIKNVFVLTDIAAASIALAHGFGRIGCLMAGCCYGKVTDAWYGIYMQNLGAKVVPLQLYEALFLFALFGFFVFMLVIKQSCIFPLYMGLYGAWRFVIEFFRQDYRGTTIVDFLSPSQFIALLMMAGAVALYFGQRALMKKIAEKYPDIKPEKLDDTAEGQGNGE